MRGGMGRGAGQGQRKGGPPTECVCPNCGERVPHERGKPCYEHVCPKCGSRMVRA